MHCACAIGCFDVCTLPCACGDSAVCLQESVAVLKKVDSGKSCRWVANKLSVGNTEVEGIVCDREDILKWWEAGEHSDKKYTKVRKIGEELDKVVWEWFTRARKES